VNPIPLASPAGDVFAYACGTCLNVRLLGETIGEADVAAQAARSLEQATACCTCRSCQTPLPARGFRECEACAAKSRALNEARWAVCRAEDAAREAAHLAATKDARASELLLSRMQRISENEWAAGWMTGLEYILWEALSGEPPTHQFYAEDLTELRELSDACDGWWMWNDGTCFVSLGEWREIYEKTKETR
jgi:hypothetical protein